MWYPNKRQWRAIWITVALATLVELVAAGKSSNGADRLVVVVIVWGALCVWRKSR